MSEITDQDRRMAQDFTTRLIPLVADMVQEYGAGSGATEAMQSALAYVLAHAAVADAVGKTGHRPANLKPLLKAVAESILVSAFETARQNLNLGPISKQDCNCPACVATREAAVHHAN